LNPLGRSSLWAAPLVAILVAGCGGSVLTSDGAGGAAGSGGSLPTGGAAGSGGSLPTGGAAGSGGALPTGGAAGSGGANADATVTTDAPTNDVQAEPVVDAAPRCPGLVGHPNADCQYPTYPGFTLRLVEEFDEPIDLSTDPHWTYSDGHSDGGYVRFAKSAITFEGGHAVITATKPPTTVPTSASYADGTDQPGQWPIQAPAGTVLSGELRTRFNNWRYGRFEARFKAAKNISVISAFFAFRSPKWQDWREIDIEVTPANPDKNCGMNLVYANNCYNYGCTESAYTNAALPSLADGGTIYDDFHTYSLVNEETGTSWYVDGEPIRTKPTSLEKSMKIMLNLWVFNACPWGGCAASPNTYPMSMLIDWVRLYQKDTDTTYPCSPLPDCQPAEDRDWQKNNAEDGLPDAAPW
jgi:beta-glucanase (GH16 family)